MRVSARGRLHGGVEDRCVSRRESDVGAERKADINVISIIGPGQGTEARIVKRVLSWSPAGFT